jgi:hypothetical protein
LAVRATLSSAMLEEGGLARIGQID